MINYQARHFAANFKTYSDLIKSYRFTGGRIPSKLAFYKAKKILKLKTPLIQRSKKIVG